MSIITTATRTWLTRSARAFRFTSENDAKLEYDQTRELGLYVHIPFCRSLCDFCPYCKVVYEKELAEKYIEALLREIDLVGSAGDQERKRVTSLYFGGGTPALLSGELKRIIQRIEKYFIITEGVGLELHPEDVTEETLRVIQDAGVTKISIGIQSFQEDYLTLLGRGESDWTGMFRALNQVKFETVSMDFIFALPDQTIESLKKDIQMAFGNGANHIAVYPFIDFTFTKRQFTKMNEKEKRKLLYDLVDYCDAQGYTRDSVWTFSKDGDSKYSSMTRDNFLGFGCSATTLLKDQFKINTFDIQGYLKRIDEGWLPTALTLKFTLRQRMVYYLFWTLYSMQVDPKRFYSFFGRSLESCYGFELWLAKILGLARKQEGRYVMTKKGSYYYHYYEHFYTLAYIDRMWHLMRNEAFPKELQIK